MQISRVNRSKNAARRAYNRMSGFYDLLAGSSETPLMHLGLQMLAVRPGESVLEIGSGTGKALVELGRQGSESGRVHGIDLSPGMLQQAHKRVSNAGLLGRVRLLEGDGTRLPYQSGSFNAVFISFTLELFDSPEIPLVLAECLRVLLPGGRLGVVAMLKRAQSSTIVRLYEWFHEHLPAYVDCRPIHASEMIQASGFILEKQDVKNMWGLPVELVVANKT
jgi:ubiquinone/menaquinone biosynthesis C-methylase UbiE